MGRPEVPIRRRRRLRYSPWYDVVGAFGSAFLIRLVALTVMLLDQKNAVAPEIGRIRNSPPTASAHLTDGA